MNKSITLSTNPLEQPAMDYALLRQEGIQHLERMAGQFWTDFNVHDPGITILEQFCYAITDLAYRIDYPMPDLLTETGIDTYDSLYGPTQILPTQPVTLSDFRKLVIDMVGVKNAWIEKVDGQIKGLYRVKIEASELLDVVSEAAAQQGRQVLGRRVMERLQQYRGLCEDFETIDVLESHLVQVNARVDVASVDDAEAILLQIYQRIAAYISPRVHFYTLDELLAEGMSVDEILDGPLLKHGFIKEAELQQSQRKMVFRTADLIGEIMDVRGVRAVRTISLSVNGQSTESVLVTLDTEKVHELDIRNSSITLERNGLPVGIDRESVRDLYTQSIRDAAFRRPFTDADRQQALPSGQDRQVEQYDSIQHQFPVTYGIGTPTLPNGATPERNAQAKQLKAYLMFFDQLLANYFAQLGHVKQLFAFSPVSVTDVTDESNEVDPQTYFSQVIDDPTLGLADIMVEDIVEDPETFQRKLQQMTEDPYAFLNGDPNEDPDEDPDYQRRNRFLNHLLARFAETFTDYALILRQEMSETVPTDQKVASDKQAFLRDYIQVGSGRGTAFNYLQPPSDDNMAGLERRICRKLGFDPAQGEELLLVEHILLRPIPGEQTPPVPLIETSEYEDPYSLQVSVLLPNWPKRFQDSNFRAFIEQTVYEETPTHLVATIRWLDQREWTALSGAYGDWLEKRREDWVG